MPGMHVAQVCAVILFLCAFAVWILSRRSQNTEASRSATMRRIMKFRPRFSLRTLFVLIALISIPLGWMAYQLNWKRQRYDFLVRNHSAKLEMRTDRAAPWSLRLFGETHADYLLYVPDADMEEARTLFPEAIKINPSPSELSAETTPRARPGAFLWTGF
jgi:hypothetical protein